MSKCRYVGSDQPRVVCEADHAPGTPPCDECRPCPEVHCRTCGHRHVHLEELDCPACVSDVRNDLARIAELSDRVGDEAAERSVESEAANLAGPAANPEAWRQRRRYGYRDGAEVRTKKGGWVGEDHPLWVLGVWELLVNEHYGHRPAGAVTVYGASAYLRANLTRLAREPEFPFDVLAKEARQCRGHLEDAMAEGERDETGAPCPDCTSDERKGPSLRKHYGADPKGRPLPAGYDWWDCPRCKARWTDDDYRKRVDGRFLDNATALTERDIERRFRVKPATLRQWAKRGKVTKRGRSDDGRVLYDTADVKRARDEDGDTNSNGNAA